MAIKQEAKDLLTSALEHDDKIQYMDLFIRMENGNVIRYKVNRKKADQLRTNEAIRQANLKHKEEMHIKRQEIDKARLDAKLNQKKKKYK